MRSTTGMSGPDGGTLEAHQGVVAWPGSLDDLRAPQVALRQARDPRSLAEGLADLCRRVTSADAAIVHLGLEREVIVVSPTDLTVADPPQLDADAAFLSLAADGAAAVRFALEGVDGSRLGIVELRSPAVVGPEAIATVRVLVELAGEVLERIRSAREGVAGGRLGHSQRIEAIGQLAGGVAHDFNNLLTAMMGYGELALRSADPTSSVARDLEELLATARSGAQLTGQLLAFSRHQPAQLAEVDLNDVVQKLVPLLTRLIGDGVSLHTSLSNEPCTSIADRAQLEQTLVNLVVNARDAVDGRGDVRIATAHEHVGERRLAADGAHIPAGSYAVLSVRDNGCGMEPAVVRQMFDPFFTTKAAGKGTGLGLAMAHATVSQAGGAIDVETVRGEGTTFRVLLPLADPGDSEAPCVLLVEDEAAIRSLLSRLLGDAGWNVVEARDGEQALSMAAELGHLDLVVTDIGLPRLPGTAVVERLRERRVDLPVLFISGFPEDPTSELRAPHTDFLAKPFSGDELLRRIGALLPHGADRRRRGAAL